MFALKPLEDSTQNKQRDITVGEGGLKLGGGEVRAATLFPACNF